MIKQTFSLFIDTRTCNFELDKHCTVWLKDQNESRTNHGETKPSRNIEEEKEIASLWCMQWV
jgi:hypothetical protein